MQPSWHAWHTSISTLCALALPNPPNAVRTLPHNAAPGGLTWSKSYPLFPVALRITHSILVKASIWNCSIGQGARYMLARKGHFQVCWCQFLLEFLWIQINGCIRSLPQRATIGEPSVRCKLYWITRIDSVATG